MQWVVDALWEAFHTQGLSWIGFYTKTPGQDEMLLAVRRDKPACSPIGLNGMCGRAWKKARPVIVDDVSNVPGGDYIACDPLDRSELVIPLLEADGACWGVLDADSYEMRSFDEHDAAEMARLVQAVGLSIPDPTDAAPLRF